MSESLTDWLPPVPPGWKVKPLYSVMSERVQPNAGLEASKVLSLSYGRIVERDVEGHFGLLPASFEGYNVVEANDIVMRLTDLQNDQRSLRTGQVSERGAITSAYVTVIPSGELLPRFAHYLLHGYDLAKVFYRMGGGLRQTMKFGDLKRLPLVVPPEAEQNRIATFLDEQTARIDALIAEKEDLGHKVKEYEQAEISRLIAEGLSGADFWETGSTFVPLAPEGWRVVPFKRAMHGMWQGWSPQCENRPADENEWGVLKVGCVNGTKFAPRENKALPLHLEPDMSCVLHRGDVLVSRANTRELVGLAALVDDDFPNLLICDKLYRLHLRSDWLLPAYAVFVLRSNASRRQIELGASGASSSMQNISQDVVRELVVALPPLEEQAAIVERSLVIRRNCCDLAAHVQEHIVRLREYRSSLISAAVTGQLDIETFNLKQCEELETE